MKRAVVKLLNKRANTLVEVIISMLIISMAAAMLTSGIMTATNMFRRGNDIMHNLATAENALEYKIAENNSTDIRDVKIDYNKGDDDDRIYIQMYLEKQSLGIDAYLYYYLY